MNSHRLLLSKIKQTIDMIPGFHFFCRASFESKEVNKSISISKQYHYNRESLYYPFSFARFNLENDEKRC